MKILFVSNSPSQTIVTVKLEGNVNVPNLYEVHLYNNTSGYTERFSTCYTHEDAAYYHKQLCEKCHIKVNM